MMQEFLAIECDTAKIVHAEIDVTPDVVITIKEKQNLCEAQHVEDSYTVLKEVTCLRSSIKFAKKTTAEAVRTIND